MLDISAGISETDGPSIVDVFPNPTSSLVMITISSAANERVVVRLLDALGREVMRLHEGEVPSDKRVFADISALSEGAYSVVVESKNGRITARVLKR